MLPLRHAIAHRAPSLSLLARLPSTPLRQPLPLRPSPSLPLPLALRRAITTAARHSPSSARSPSHPRRVLDDVRAFSRRTFSSDGGGGSTTAKSKSTSDSSTGSSETTASGEPMSFSLLWKRYGAVAIATHFGVYFATLAGLYGGVSAGLLGQGDEKKEAIEKVAIKIEPVSAGVSWVHGVVGGGKGQRGQRVGHLGAQVLQFPCP